MVLYGPGETGTVDGRGSSGVRAAGVRRFSFRFPDGVRMGCTGSAGMPLPEPADRVFAVPRGRARIGAGVAIDRDCRGCYRIDAVVRNGFVESFAVRHDRIVFQSGPLLQLPRRDRSRGVLLRADSACRSGRSVGVERAREIRTVVESGYADLLRILAFLAAGSGCLAGDPGADCVAGGAGERFGCGMPRDARAGIYPKVLPTQEVSVCNDWFGRARSGRRVAGRVVPVQKGFGRRPVADLERVGAVDP